MKKLICKWFGHSFGWVELIMFKIECEGRCYMQDVVTGEITPSKETPSIKCNRCGEILRKKSEEVGA